MRAYTMLGPIAAAVLLAVIGATLPAAAQNPTPTGFGPSGSLPAPRPRIEVNPLRPLYRRCASWYVVQNRPSGTVLFPQKHCWWVRG
jgi:hypothetical protein